MLINSYKYDTTIQQFKNTVANGLDTTGFQTKNGTNLLGSDTDSCTAASSEFSLAAESSSHGAKFTSNLLLDLTNQIYDSQSTVNSVLSNLIIPDEVLKEREEHQAKYGPSKKETAKQQKNPFENQKNQEASKALDSQQSQNQQNNNPFTQRTSQDGRDGARLVHNKGHIKNFTKYVHDRPSQHRGGRNGSYVDYADHRRQQRHRYGNGENHGQRYGQNNRYGHHNQSHGQRDHRFGPHGPRFGQHGANGHHGQHGHGAHGHDHEGGRGHHGANRRNETKTETKTVTKRVKTGGGKGKKGGTKTVTKKVKVKKKVHKPASPPPKPKKPVNPKHTENRRPMDDIKPKKPIDNAKKPPIDKQPQPKPTDDNKPKTDNNLKDKLKDAELDKQKQADADKQNQAAMNDANKDKALNDAKNQAKQNQNNKTNNTKQADSGTKKVTEAREVGGGTSKVGGSGQQVFNKAGEGITTNKAAQAAKKVGMSASSREELIKMKEEMDAMKENASISLKALEAFTSGAAQKFKKLREEALSMSTIASKQAIAERNKNMDPTNMLAQDNKKTASDKKLLLMLANSQFSFA